MMGLEEKVEVIEAIRAVRLAAHELANACSVVVGGTEMAISIATVDRLGDDPRKGGRARLDSDTH